MTRFKKLSDFSQSLNEENLSGLANAHPWGEIEKMGTKLVEGQPIQLTANLFGTGVDKIDVNSTAFQDAVQLLRWLWINQYNQAGQATEKLLVRGSASAVGSSSGYDNFALAQRRANNLVDALKKWFDKNTPATSPNTQVTIDLNWASLTKYIKISKDAVVGSATKKGSPEALAEQCVYLIWIPTNKQKNFKYDLVQPIDNTATVVPMPLIQPLEPEPVLVDVGVVRCGCCGRSFTESDKTSWVIKRFNWSLNELKNGWLKDRTGETVWKWLTDMSK